MRTVINKIKQIIEGLLHRHCGTPKCCGQCSKAGSYVHKQTKECDKDNTYETLYGGNDE